MKKSENYEKERQIIQADLDIVKTQAERNRMGQFSTPKELAIDIIKFAKELTSSHTKVNFLDPAFGTGSFYSALLNIFPIRRIVSAKGFEIDPYYGKPAKRLWSKTLLKLHINDFTKADLPNEESEKFDLIICNPPYVRHHHILIKEKERLQGRAKEISGIRLSGLSGLYCYFLVLSNGWMKKNGVAGWLIPSEFMDVNYGKALKSFLLDKVTLIQIHRFDPNEVQFEDALVSSAIVWFRKSRPPFEYQVKFTYGGMITEPHKSKLITTEVLRRESKWTRFPLSGIRESLNKAKLSDFFLIKRGIATGDNSFFILNREQMKAKKLPICCFRPILPSPRYLKNNEVKSDEKGFPSIETQLFLLDCRLPETDIKDRYPELWEYLQEGKKKGVADRYLCRHRIPWYSQEERQESPIICTYIGRGDKNNGKPFRFILNHSKATVTNSYLILYPKTEIKHVIIKKPLLVRQIWKILNEISPKSMIEEGRFYGGGLYKLEPRELAKVSAESLLSIFPNIKKSQRQLKLFENL